MNIAERIFQYLLREEDQTEYERVKAKYEEAVADARDAFRSVASSGDNYGSASRAEKKVDIWLTKLNQIEKKLGKKLTKAPIL